MKNADMPAMPIFDECGRPTVHGMSNVEVLGLTKREMMAMHILSGLLSDPNWIGMPADAVRIADELLAELEKQQ